MSENAFEHATPESRGSQRGCGNADGFSKRAYYLYPDSVDMNEPDCNDSLARSQQGDEFHETPEGVTHQACEDEQNA